MSVIRSMLIAYSLYATAQTPDLPMPAEKCFANHECGVVQKECEHRKKPTKKSDQHSFELERAACGLFRLVAVAVSRAIIVCDGVSSALK